MSSVAVLLVALTLRTALGAAGTAPENAVGALAAALHAEPPTLLFTMIDALRDARRAACMGTSWVERASVSERRHHHGGGTKRAIESEQSGSGRAGPGARRVDDVTHV
jgi:hypothetical protein